ncbi:DUF6082 family protein [Streptomyces sp. NRRL S-37]|uniref:DUF6082 family protein n=1 Tax=Streptomyces sp. NRRL S-37 TaxID=1463903 RepID=UPI001F277842|nr:DUF6082 family protein [Streptomyces sp. NRRL S-37]
MAHHGLRRSAIALSAWTAAAAFCIVIVGVASVVISGWLVSGVERTNGDLPTAAERSALGDYFGGVNSVFSGLALLMLVIALFFQQRELRSQREELALQREELVASREELRRSAEADLRGLHVQLTEMAMADPSLAEVWNDLPRAPAGTLRQYLFANLAFSHYVLMHSWGHLSEDELLVYANSLLRSPVFRQYWEATRSSKSGLPADSSEGRVFRVFEQAMTDLE